MLHNATPEPLRSGKEVYESTTIFGNCTALVFVIDALVSFVMFMAIIRQTLLLQDDDLGKPVAMLLDTIAHVLGVNRRIDIQVFVQASGAFSISCAFF